MATVYDTDENGNIIVVFDSRWRFPETLGFSPDDPEYKQLQRMWENATEENVGSPTANMKEENANARTGKGKRKN